MRLWVLVLIVCIVQEFTSTNAVLLAAYHAGYPLLVVHLLYAAGTILDFFIGYALGVLVHRRYANTRPSRWAEHVSQTYLGKLGRIGKRYLLFLIGALNFTYIDAFLIPWLNVSWREAFVIFFGANVLWYAFQWAFVLGVNLLFPNPLDAFVGVIASSLVLVVLWHVVVRRLLSRW